MEDAPMNQVDQDDVVEGGMYWFDGFLLKVLLDAGHTGGALSICEQRHPMGYGTPVHVHGREDQTLHVLEGRITAWLGADDARTERPLVEGDTVFLPRGVPHAFRVDEEGTRLLEINTPGGFEGFHIDAGEPAPEERLPDPTPPDMDRLMEVAPRYDCQVLGPPIGR
jgi:mannose-6-phosphate isomerase-like protein (cupin superfamily)